MYLPPAQQKKYREIMAYASVQAVRLGRYADSVLASSSFFQQRWLSENAMEPQSEASECRTKEYWPEEVDRMIESARITIRAIVSAGGSQRDMLLAYYLTNLTLDGAEAFLAEAPPAADLPIQCDPPATGMSVNSTPFPGSLPASSPPPAAAARPGA